MLTRFGCTVILCCLAALPVRSFLAPAAGSSTLSSTCSSSGHSPALHQQQQLFAEPPQQQRQKAWQQQQEAWTGDVVSGGKIHGCFLQQVEGSLTQWIVTIDGVEADLGRFSDVIYKKLLQNAKQERFQGFRPGTVPPHLLGTYKAFAMDECARETVLEALQQNSIRPFENCRVEMELVDFSIPPPAPSKKKKGKKRKKSKTAAVDDNADDDEATSEPAPSWRSFATMKEALDAGWTPGQSFSFVARKVTGQQVKDDEGAAPVARPF